MPYLFTVTFFVVHVYEEYLTDFEVAMTDITGFHVLERDFLTFAAFLAPVIWLTGAILLLKRTHVGYYFQSAFYVAMVIAEFAHFVFPFMEDGTSHYVSGMYTSSRFFSVSRATTSCLNRVRAGGVESGSGVVFSSFIGNTSRLDFVTHGA